MNERSFFKRRRPRSKTYHLNTLDEEAQKKAEAVRRAAFNQPTSNELIWINRSCRARKQQEQKKDALCEAAKRLTPDELIRLNQTCRPKKQQPPKQKPCEAEVQLQAPSKESRLDWLWDVAAAVGAVFLIYDFCKN